MWIFIKYIFITCLLSVCTACYLLCATQDGLQYDLQWLAKRLPGQLTIKKVEGNLLSGFSLHDLSYRTTDQNISFKKLKIHWDPILLLKGKCYINQLDIEDGQIILSDKNKKSEKINPLLLSAWHHMIIQHVAIKSLYVEQSASSIEVNGDLTDHWDLRWKLRALPIKKWFPDYHGNLDSEGTISGELSEPTLHALFNVHPLAFHGQSISQLKGQADLTLKKSHSESSIRLILIDSKLQNHFYKKIFLNATGKISVEKQKLNALLNVQLDNKNILSATIALPHYSGITNPNQTIDGHMTILPSEIGQLLTSIAYIKNPRGKFSAGIDIHGLLYKPIVTGEFKLHSADFLIPMLGIHPEALNIQGNLGADKIIRLQGHIQSGTGKAKLNGTIDLTDNEKPIIISLQGENLAAIRLPEYKISISPEVKATLTYPYLQLQGKVLIPYAEIKPKNFSGTTTLPDEVIFVQDKNTAPTSPWYTELNIQLNLGENISVNYGSLQATLGGSIHITKSADTPAIAQGEFYALEGRYTAYGQKLAIEMGSLIYTGNTLTNPGLDIKAVKKVRRIVTNNPNDFVNNNPSIPVYAGTESVKVGIRVNGTADKPVISLFSTPSDLSQGDILSYIILGQPQSNTSGAQGAAILSILNTLNPNSNKIKRFTDKLQETLGLTELNIEAVQNFNPISKSIESTTSFVIGKQLTKKLSLHYSIGLFDPVSVLNLRYQINNHWALQSETSTVDNGADLVYVFERD